MPIDAKPGDYVVVLTPGVGGTTTKKGDRFEIERVAQDFIYVETVGDYNGPGTGWYFYDDDLKAGRWKLEMAPRSEPPPVPSWVEKLRRK